MPIYLDLMKLRAIDKNLLYSWLYHGYGVRERIDEEGCGAVFAAALELSETGVINEADVID